MVPRYKCTNEDCPNYDEVVELRPGMTAECQYCGWFMEGE